MSVSKYEITDISTVFDGTVLHRIKALKTIPNVVEKGELGGWIEDPSNLSQEGTCWIFDNAMVMGNALVEGAAKVKHHSLIKDDAIVQDEAVIKNYVTIQDDTVITGSAIIEGHVTVKDNALVGHGSQVSGDSVIAGFTWLKGDSTVIDSNITDATLSNCMVNSSDISDAQLTNLSINSSDIANIKLEGTFDVVDAALVDQTDVLAILAGDNYLIYKGAADALKVSITPPIGTPIFEEGIDNLVEPLKHLAQSYFNIEGEVNE